MKYWKQFAAMLGLELGQEFVITDDDGKRQGNNTYEITEDGISVKNPTNIVLCCRIPAIFTNVLDGNYKVSPKPFKPKNGEKYFIYEPGVVDDAYSFWADDDIDLCRWKCGNCFKTKEEAETKGKEIMEKLVKEYEEA